MKKSNDNISNTEAMLLSAEEKLEAMMGELDDVTDSNVSLDPLETRLKGKAVVGGKKFDTPEEEPKDRDKVTEARSPEEIEDTKRELMDSGMDEDEANYEAENYGDEHSAAVDPVEVTEEEMSGNLDDENDDEMYYDEAPDPDDIADESSLAVVDIDGSPLPPYLQYNSNEDTEDSAGLDSLAHTHQGPPNEIQEAVIKQRKLDKLFKKKFLREANLSGSKSQIVTQYLGQETSPSFQGYLSWARDNGVENISSASNFNRVQSRFEMSRPTEPEPEPEPFDPTSAPDELQQLMGLYSQASDEDAQVEPSVSQKFEAIYATGYRTAKGRALKKHAFICGSPGIGKTYTVIRAVKQGADETGFLFANYRGSIGKSLTAILSFLWTHRENYVILLDDADGFLTGSSDDVINTLKAAMDTDEPVVSTGDALMRRRLAKMNEGKKTANLFFDTSQVFTKGILEAYDKDGILIKSETLSEEDLEFWAEYKEATTRPERFPIKEFFTKEFYGRVTEDEDEYEDEDAMFADEMEDDGEGEAMFPTSFLFDSKIIFVSNMMQSEIPDAINGRCNVKELYLTRLEIMTRLEQILPELLKNETAYSREEINWAKANVFRWMKAVVQAVDMKAPLRVASGKPVPAEINIPITFRMFNDFVDGWMQLADAKMAGKIAGSDEKAFEKVEKMIALRFISQVILPTFKGDQRSKKRRR